MGDLRIVERKGANGTPFFPQYENLSGYSRPHRSVNRSDHKETGHRAATHRKIHQFPPATYCSDSSKPSSASSGYGLIMSQDTTIPSVRPQPMIAVADVPASSRWYQQVLGATSGHGGREDEAVLVDGQLIMQLHEHETGHHHGTIGDRAQPTGNGVALWFEMAGFDAAVQRVREAGATIVTDVHLNPNAGHREIWLRDPDGYLVVFAEPYSGFS